jgi:hypothetical protein
LSFLYFLLFLPSPAFLTRTVRVPMKLAHLTRYFFVP